MNMFAGVAQTMNSGSWPAAAPLTLPLDAAFLQSVIQTGALFAKLRQYLNLTPDQVAVRLHTFPAVVVALESGRFQDLPPWHLTRHLASNYATMAGIDPEPALHVLEQFFRIKSAHEAELARLAAGAVPMTHPRFPPSSAPAPAVIAQQVQPLAQTSPPQRSAFAALLAQQQAKPDPAPRTAVASAHAITEDEDDHGEHDEHDGAGHDEGEPGLAARALGMLPSGWLMWRIAGVALLLTVAGLGTQSSALQAAMTKLPAPLSTFARQAHDAILLKTANRFEGMPWIDVADPRSRKADKLPVKYAANRRR